MRKKVDHPDEAIKGIYLRGSVYWLARQINKKRTYVSLETSDMAEAIKRAREIEDFIPDQRSLPDLVDEYVMYCLESRIWTASTVDSKSPVLRVWAKEMKDKSPHEITTDVIERYYRKRVKKVAETTAYGNLMMLQGFFNWCDHIEKCIKFNPVTPLTSRSSMQRIRPPAPVARKRFCTHDLRDKLISECPREDLKYVLFCGFHAGLRFTEIVESQANWFDLDNLQLHLRKHEGIQFKDREERSIPMTNEFVEFIHEYGLHEPYMLHPERAQGKSLRRYDFSRPFECYMKDQGVQWVTPHVMRHTFASLLASAGVSIFHIASWMGDGVRVVERHYAHLIPMHSEIERAFSARKANQKRPPLKRRPPLDKSSSSKPMSRRNQKE